MASVAERARARRARTAARAAARGESGEGPAAVRAPSRAAAAAAEDQNGLEYLVAKGRISRAQAEAGRRYGTLWRAARSEGCAPIRVMDMAGAGVRGAGAGAPPPIDAAFGAWVVQCRRDLAAARGAIAEHEGLVALLDTVCGAGLKPRQISTVQRETEQMETALRVALDLLLRHFRSCAA